MTYDELPLCKQCGSPYHPDLSEEGTPLRKGVCFPCVQNWLEPLLVRMVRVHGRKRTRQLLESLAR